jgi:hypothetical protein
MMLYPKSVGNLLKQVESIDAVQEMFLAAFATFQDKLTVDNAFKKACMLQVYDNVL